jgi:histone H3/H4
MSNITLSNLKEEFEEIEKTFTNLTEEFQGIQNTCTNLTKEFDEILHHQETSQDESDECSDIESTDVSSIEMTDTETSDEEDIQDDMSIDSEAEDEDKAIEEIRYYQRTTHDIIPFENFELLVREIMQDFNKELDVDDEAVKAMQAATESYLVELFSKTQTNAIHGGRQVITPKDLQLARYHAKERE